MKGMKLIKTAPLAVLLVLASCASKKAIVADNGSMLQKVASDNTDKDETKTQRHESSTMDRAFLEKVADNAVCSKNITGRMSFNLQAGGKDITVPGAIRMRKDEVIRLQLFIPILGSEIGRIEFTPDYVLIIDRMHKEYIKAGYGEVSFLSQNGISFYSLQSLFWNQLFLPGHKSVSESSLGQFASNSNTAGSLADISYRKGNILYTWKADKATGRITSAGAVYRSASHGKSELKWNYSNFKNVGVKQFPADQTFTFTTEATKKLQKATVSISMNDVKTESDWDTNTVVSTKYKKANVDDILKKIIIVQ